MKWGNLIVYDVWDIETVKKIVILTIILMIFPLWVPALWVGIDMIFPLPKSIGVFFDWSLILCYLTHLYLVFSLVQKISFAIFYTVFYSVFALVVLFFTVWWASAQIFGP